MPASIELPQCPICQDPFTKSERVGRPMAPKGCGKSRYLRGGKLGVANHLHIEGHVYCKECADAHFRKLANTVDGRDIGYACPLCRLPCTRNELVELYLDFGRHDVGALPTFDRAEQEDRGELLLTVKNLGISDRGERAIRKLSELVAQRPNEWKPTRTKAKRLDASVFHLVGSVIRDVAKNITGQETVKDVLHRLSSALEDLQKIQQWHSKAMELAEDHARLRKRKEELKAELEETKRTHELQLKDRERKLALRFDESEEKQADLKRRLHERCEELESDRQKLRQTDEVRARLEEQIERWRKDSTKNKKRFELKRQEYDNLKAELDKMKALHQSRRFDDTSDSSLQVIEDDEEIEIQVEDNDELDLTPPTSSSTSLKQGIPTVNEPHTGPSSLTMHSPGQGVRSGPSVIINHASSDPSHVIAPSMRKTKQARPKREALSRDRDPGRPRAMSRIPTMPVPPRSGTLRIHASPKKKQRMTVDV